MKLVGGNQFSHLGIHKQTNACCWPGIKVLSVEGLLSMELPCLVLRDITTVS